MELQEVVRRRRMVRAFDGRPVPPEVLERILENATHAPSAGFTQGWAFVVLEGDALARFWELTADPEWRAGRAGTRHEVMTAPVVVVALSHPQAYLDRYAEPDKAASGLAHLDAWPVPYWDVDTGFAVLLMLLTAVDAGLGALLFRIRHGERAFLDATGVPDGYRAVGAVAIGYPAPDTRSPSLERGRRPLDEVVHWGRWGITLRGSPAAPR